ncbi:MAG: hypothetical protein HC822_21450 [Oscillochloris sp.]|nr:hypothetical protein [Oscillochloris sp.]
MPHPSLPSRIIVGYRTPGNGPLGDPNAAQQVLTGIVKGTFNAGGSGVSPAVVQFPLFEQDVFFNLVRNGEFSSGAQMAADGAIITPVAGWTSPDENTTIAHLDAPQHMQVNGAGRVVQPVAFDRALGGRTFTLRYRARAAVNTSIPGIRLETPTGTTLFGGTQNLTSGFSEFEDSATWPPDVDEAQALLVLHGAAGVAVEYAWVRLNEGNTILPLDPLDPIRYEHDLAIFKPRADLVILGRPDPPQPDPADDGWIERVLIGGTSLTAVFDTHGRLTEFNDGAVAAGRIPWSNTTPITIGWQDRAADDNPALNKFRKGYAGNVKQFNPDTMQLPQGFYNLFFNGALYSGPQPPFGHIGANVITVATSGLYDDGAGGTETITNQTSLHLPDAPQMTVTFRSSAAPDAPTSSAMVAMNLDTIVYDKATALFYAVWRGVWTGFSAVGFERLVRVAFGAA